ncbi:uncharacterized protein LOC122650730 [Telopea speciosissima]|uniref:uncharacterized protein LOC122650730 n=1 Tax=Telopea speciosissima TaxID=54955 RepID=UPI001CC4BCC1|nr:uncharacterized protein LOC122650730 [Telopea speciosissima]
MKSELKAVQEEIKLSGMSDQLFEREMEAKKAYNSAAENFEKLWAEKSRLKRRSFGDRCSKFFHLSTKMGRVKNTIRSLKTADGEVLVDQELIKKYVEDYYENVHKAVEVSEHEEILNCIPRVLEEVDIFRLELVPCDSKIRAVVWTLDPDSTPGPGGFPGAFFRACWEVIGADVCSAARSFFSSSRIPAGINNYFIALIPKVEGAASLEKFRPLCMGNFFYKILSKVMSRRLELVLPRLILDEQGAFQKGKVIQDNISIASELANLLAVATRGGGLGLKIDIQKAYDTLSWDFMFSVLLKFGFSGRWIQWLRSLLSSTRISVLVNGGPVGFFGVDRDLRQGDPILPLLFIVVEEVLCRGLTKLLDDKKILSLNGPWGIHTPRQYLLADDIFIFTNASIQYVRNLKAFLNQYQEFLGQRINLDKSKLFLGSIPTRRRQAIVEELQIPVCKFPTRYLGVEISKGQVRKRCYCLWWIELGPSLQVRKGSCYLWLVALS